MICHEDHGFCCLKSHVPRKSRLSPSESIDQVIEPCADHHAIIFPVGFHPGELEEYTMPVFLVKKIMNPNKKSYIAVQKYIYIDTEITFMLIRPRSLNIM
jgi:hypothetical protein